ncbi:hypothetical protein H7U19_15430 [Hyunsoonleella sp. SJ7]|uniref:Alpha/beta hydrolase n=1 Tax=Hyunsoonleella aquatilis TaxID=2762758 RepID=A0A923KJ79_9FLAO|nr:hypothetical protein [Hyunsoonleella aquatilis]MBC3759804.1 hypothetical protein [Hyunsoonleella aquatilis]
MKKIRILSLLIIVISSKLQAQDTLVNIQNSADSYLFYLHGGVVQAQGIPAVSEYFGSYEYLAILDSLSNYRTNIISEVRPKDSTIEGYGQKIFVQVDSLLNMGILPEKITVVGASLGAYMTVEASLQVNNPSVNYVLIGLCSDSAVDRFRKYNRQFKGRFLSIYESSDAKGSCSVLFEELSPASSFDEIRLNMGIDHSFLFKPYDDWVKPMMKWIKKAYDE